MRRFLQLHGLRQIASRFVSHSGLNPRTVRHSDLLYSLDRIDEELCEARDAIGSLDRKKFAAELADVVISVAVLAYRMEIDLPRAIREKHRINMARKWAPHPTLEGCVQHVREKEGETTK